jgi:hypothetical protein
MANKNKKKKNKQRGKRKRHVSQGVAGFRAITQNVSVAVGTPFGDNPRPATIANGLDAFNPCSVPLPRAIGDYTVVRTTQVFSSKDALMLFGPILDGRTTDKMWSSAFCQSSVASGSAINAANNTRITGSETMNTLDWQYARMVPAAFSVQIMNPNALQTTSGIAYAGRSRQMVSVADKSITWDALGSELISFSDPRLLSAGKLALRGVQMDAVPFDMNAMSDFHTRYASTSGPYTNTDPALKFDAMAPLFVSNPNGIPLQFLICCEWRVRFDPSNPAYAANTYHTPSSMGYWDKLQRVASYVGNGVVDIVERASDPRAVAGALRMARMANAAYGARGSRAMGWRDEL